MVPGPRHTETTGWYDRDSAGLGAPARWCGALRCRREGGRRRCGGRWRHGRPGWRHDGGWRLGPPLQLGDQAVLEVEQILHRAVDSCGTDHGTGGHLDQSRSDPDLIAHPLVGTTQDPSRIWRGACHHFEAGSSLQTGDERLHDAGANPGVLCLACDVGERLDRDGAAVLRCRDDGH